MVSTFNEFNVMLQEHPFDILTLSETWLKDDVNLLMFKYLVISLATGTETKEEEVSVYRSKIQLNSKCAMILTKYMKVSNFCGSSVKNTTVIKAI